jgi:cytoskeletal protein CcmA (bactofilin family)
MSRTLQSVFAAYRSSDAKASPSATTAESTDSPGAANPRANSRPVIVLGKTLFLKGELSSDEDLLLLGRVEGSITHTQSLTVGIGGVIVGDLQARTVIVKGTVDGDIEATHSVVVSAHAVVNGDIKAPRVSILEGAQFNGAVTMTPMPAVEPAKDGEPTDAVSDSERILSADAVDQMLMGD